MKRIIALVLAALMLYAVSGTLAEEGRLAPLYATVGEAMDDSFEGPVVAGGITGDYFAVVTKKDGKYYRSVANYDEKLNELSEVVQNLDFEAEDFFEKHDAASNAVDEYLKTLPIAYSEEFTARPLTDDEMASMLGKTLAQLTEEGFEVGNERTEGGGDTEIYIVFRLRYGVYDYDCVVDADFDQYNTAKDNGTESGLIVKGVVLAGITEWGFDKRFHTDGTVDEPEDPFAEFNEIMAEVGTLIEKSQAGEEVNFEEFIDTLKAKYPDYADMINMYMALYQAYGVEGIVSMMTPAE